MRRSDEVMFGKHKWQYRRAYYRVAVLATVGGLGLLTALCTRAHAADYEMPFLERSLNKTVIHQGSRSQTIGIGRGTRHIYVPDRRRDGASHRRHRGACDGCRDGRKRLEYR